MTMLRSVVVACLLTPCLAAPDFRFEATVVNEAHMPDGKRRAQLIAGKEGFVASLPQLMWARANAPYDNVIWNNWFTANTEECAFTTKEGRKVVVVVHGGGILDGANRMEESYRMDGSGVALRAGRVTEQEAHGLLRGALAGGAKIPVFSYSEFLREPNVPQRYAVVLDAQAALASPNGYAPVSSLYWDRLFVARAGGLKQATAYLDKAKERHNTTKYGTWHPYARVDFSQPQCTVVFLSGNRGGRGSDGSGSLAGYAADYGIGGDANIQNRGRYVAVARVNQSTAIGNANFPSKGSRRKLRAQAVWAPNLPLALTTAQLAAGSDGYVATMPDLIAARTSAPFQSEVWGYEYTTNSEESIVEGEDGRLKVVTVHGGGIFSSPKRLLEVFGMDDLNDLMTGDYGARLSKAEARDLLRGSLPDGSRIPMYSFEAFRRGVAGLPRRYGVITDYAVANTSVRSDEKLDVARHDPMLLVHAGGKERAAAYVNKVSKRQSTLGNWNPYNSLWDALVPSCRILSLDADGGFASDDGVVEPARYVALAPDDQRTSLRLLNFLVPSPLKGELIV